MDLYFYPLILIVAYLFGSFPSAYLFLRWFGKKDIRTQGSGNVGAMNALRTSNSKMLAVGVLLFDLVKGAVPTWFILYRTSWPQEALLLLLAGLLLGHLFPVWLRFKGGRGLAVAAGALLVIQPLLVAIWLVVWAVFYVLFKKHILASIIATFILPLVVFFTKDYLFSDQILLYVLLVCILIFQRHLERIPDLVEEKRLKIQNGVTK